MRVRLFVVLVALLLPLLAGSSSAAAKRPYGWQCEGIGNAQVQWDCYVRFLLDDIDRRGDPAKALPRIDALARATALTGECHALMHEVGRRYGAEHHLTLGGLMKHLAVVDSSWFEYDYAGGPFMPPFDAVDWDADPDWEWRTAADDSPEELRRLFDEGVRRADAVVDAAIAEGRGLDSLSVRTSAREGGRFTLRWILVHMIEEYARHNGHADLLRESVDGQTGE